MEDVNALGGGHAPLEFLVGDFLLRFGSTEDLACALCTVLAEDAGVARFAATLSLSARLDLIEYLIDERQVSRPLLVRWKKWRRELEKLQSTRNALAHNGTLVEVFLSEDGTEHGARRAVSLRRKEAESREVLPGLSAVEIARDIVRLNEVSDELALCGGEITACERESAPRAEVERARSVVRAAAALAAQRGAPSA